MRDDINITHLHFKYAFRQCKLSEEKSRDDVMAKMLHNRNNKGFWKYVKNYVPLFSKVNSITDT